VSQSSTQVENLEALQNQNARLKGDIDRLVNIDQLTGLFHRHAFIKKVDAHLTSDVGPTKQSAMIELGLRGLPRITGSLGRHVGDYLVSALAARLLALAAPGTICCRLDYRSFAVFIPVISDPLEALTAAKSLMMKLMEPVDWVDRKLTVLLGAGVALSSPTEKDATILLQNADQAHKSATAKGGPGYAFFNPTLAQASRRRNEIILALNECIDNHTLTLHYQPFFAARSGELLGFEALLRLNHPRLGTIQPVEFIPVAEEIGYIGKLGAWALAEACRTASLWPQHLIVAVNVSPQQFQGGTLLTDVHNALELSSLPAYRLEVEITESTMMHDVELVSSQISSLKEMGCGIVLDDFGTGFSSLSYLWKYPFSKIKIDRSFISAISLQPRVRGMLSSIMQLGKNLGLKVTAEGIETIEQANLMQDIKCDVLQGYLCGKPAPQEELAAIILARFAHIIQTDLATSHANLNINPSRKIGAR
jgi:predicted signal transduction protein with EAL and GGDEF domain